MPLVRARSRRNPITAPSTLAFRRWFAGSWVVDARGQPLLVYRGEHGQDTSELMRSRMGSGVLSFTDRADLASHFALKRYDDGEIPTPRLIPVFLRIKNPVITPDDVNKKKNYTVSTKRMVERVGLQAVKKVFDEFYKTFPGVLEKGEKPLPLMPFMYMNNKNFVREAQKKGFDGALFQSEYQLYERGQHTKFGLCMEYRPFNREQIWPALGNGPLV